MRRRPRSRTCELRPLRTAAPAPVVVVADRRLALEALTTEEALMDTDDDLDPSTASASWAEIVAALLGLAVLIGMAAYLCPVPG